jgi:hypothetical protein
VEGKRVQLLMITELPYCGNYGGYGHWYSFKESHSGSSATTSSNFQRWSDTPAAIAGRLLDPAFLLAQGHVWTPEVVIHEPQGHRVKVVR